MTRQSHSSIVSTIIPGQEKKKNSVLCNSCVHKILNRYVGFNFILLFGVRPIRKQAEEQIYETITKLVPTWDKFLQITNCRNNWERLANHEEEEGKEGQRIAGQKRLCPSFFTLGQSAEFGPQSQGKDHLFHT
ncbi:(S)-beta-bisabolene synthase [Plakobranchus ocellatus]|uniref:(S)-beta-bisabolene synthase n=1 Tax=Plakobranchus ocellatus TaxID=259542 RepID=A0AAV4A032_9GAST|nr:(S)-beta-bisabolene synthase [Plakobranchus ocellatus]